LSEFEELLVRQQVNAPKNIIDIYPGAAYRVFDIAQAYNLVARKRFYYGILEGARNSHLRGLVLSI
jgi:hypothetical protein